jgi:ribosomal protein S27AE
MGVALTITTWFSVALVRKLARDTQCILQQYQLACPRCGHGMLALHDLTGRLTAVDLTVETGRCSHCGEVSFAA